MLNRTGVNAHVRGYSVGVPEGREEEMNLKRRRRRGRRQGQGKCPEEKKLIVG